jgi:hypothetical protein
VDVDVVGAHEAPTRCQSALTFGANFCLEDGSNESDAIARAQRHATSLRTRMQIETKPFVCGRERGRKSGFHLLGEMYVIRLTVSYARTMPKKLLAR